MIKRTAFTEWETPQRFYNSLNDEFHFTLDAACSHKTAKCQTYFTEIDDGLSKDWSQHTVWLNPPYDKTIPLWIKKAYETSQQGGLVVCLIQGRSTDTIMWHNYVMRASELIFIKDRLHFGKNGNHARANISSVVVVFRPHCSGPPVVSAMNAFGERIKSIPKENTE